MAQHLAPRMIQHDSACSAPIQIIRSILAGCAHSINLTRGLLKFDFQKLIDTNVDVTLETLLTTFLLQLTIKVDCSSRAILLKQPDVTPKHVRI